MLTIHATSLAHTIHYAVVGVGVVGLLLLLAPRFVGAQRPADEHERRVLALAGQISTGSLGRTPTAPVPQAAPGTVSAAADSNSLWLPLAAISSAAAAAVHAAVGPEHFGERVVFGMFFAAAALAQMSWSWAMVVRPGRRLVHVGAVGTFLVLTLWLVTRTVGLPFGLLPRPEALGPWDICSVVWELTVVLACTQLLHTLPRSAPSTVPSVLRLPGWAAWHRAARGWTVGSVVVLAALSLSGASS